ncbi:glycerophosphodiester phosphodiesterase family protein [Arsenicicoccus dermatophilus]|uniref:glycerophosphodiester phosphodiesterase family protein n=1 Tax=Arsenicicoccus dermatophilus TaxID=1076331 RepID=UPI001F4C963D|nr:glycerophosphodiester phosphodiesterase family protein [Arsenicicoccus dermatophilus]MCH8611720.1 glycerophosphodiester phosphodiesterase [Arsenicicoccus dermatophilus]
MAYGDGPGPLALAHRGGAQLAPENTLAAFERSVALGVRYLESDIRLTADGEIVCFHDETVDRVTDGTGPVNRLTLAQARRLRVCGQGGIPTLVEALEIFPEACFSIDLKDAAAIGPLVQVLRQRRYRERVCVAGAWDGWLRQVRAEVPGVSTSLGWRSLTTLIACSRAGVPVPRWIASADFAHVPIRLGRVPVFVEEVVHLAHSVGVRVITWTCNDPVAMDRLYSLGVDGVISDRPDLLREVLVARGDWTPMAGSARGASDGHPQELSGNL